MRDGYLSFYTNECSECIYKDRSFIGSTNALLSTYPKLHKRCSGEAEVTQSHEFHQQHEAWLAAHTTPPTESLFILQKNKRLFASCLCKNSCISIFQFKKPDTPNDYQAGTEIRSHAPAIIADSSFIEQSLDDLSASLTTRTFISHGEIELIPGYFSFVFITLCCSPVKIREIVHAQHTLMSAYIQGPLHNPEAYREKLFALLATIVFKSLVHGGIGMRIIDNDAALLNQEASVT